MLDCERLIRFRTGGAVHYGEPILDTDSANQDFQRAVLSGSVRARVISAPSGIFSSDAALTSEQVQVDELLCPLDRRDVPIIRCIGLNYKQHSTFVLYFATNAGRSGHNRMIGSERVASYSS